VASEREGVQIRDTDGDSPKDERKKKKGRGVNDNSDAVKDDGAGPKDDAGVVPESPDKTTPPNALTRRGSSQAAEGTIKLTKDGKVC
jgi:hypothetical protein